MGVTRRVVATFMCALSLVLRCCSQKCSLGQYRKLCFTCISGYNCSPCPPGKFKGAVGRRDHQCEPCPRGRFSSQAKQSECSRCHQGHYMNLLGAKVCKKCENCKAGSRMQKCGGIYGPGLCLRCPHATFSFAGASLCVGKCPAPFSFNNLSGVQACAACPIGQYTPHSGKSFCLMGKPPANLIPKIVASKLTSCLAGKFGVRSKYGALLSCISCPQGYYAPNWKMRSCKPCKIGFFATNTGARVCAGCKAGFYGVTLAGTKCILCPSGKFGGKGKGEGAGGRMTCDPCGPGMYQYQYGASSCNKCPSGLYSRVGMRSKCIKPGIGLRLLGRL